jgi:hypothetical protein
MRKIELGLCKAEEFLGWARPLRPGFAERHRYKKKSSPSFQKRKKENCSLGSIHRHPSPKS